MGKCRLQRMRQEPCIVRLGRIRGKPENSPDTDRSHLEWPRSTCISNDTTFTLQHTGYLGGQVLGKQTVPRAELWGAIQILSRIDGKTNIQIPIDATSLVATNRGQTELDLCPKIPVPMT